MSVPAARLPEFKKREWESAVQRQREARTPLPPNSTTPPYGIGALRRRRGRVDAISQSAGLDADAVTASSMSVSSRAIYSAADDCRRHVASNFFFRGGGSVGCLQF